jgi:hypothetical protein
MLGGSQAEAIDLHKLEARQPAFLAAGSTKQGAKLDLLQAGVTAAIVLGK